MKIFSKLIFVLGAALVVLGMIYFDVVSRAKAAYLEGEKYMDWYAHPEKKVQYFQSWFEREKEKLSKLKSSNKLTEDEYVSRLESLEFEKNFNIRESSLKYAYQWYRDAYELFSPPESKWVVLSRQKANVVLELWKQELHSKKVPFENYMFE